MTTYRSYGCSAADQFTGPGAAGATASVWTQRVGGLQILDLQTTANVATNQITADANGYYPFRAPDSLGALWLDPGLASGQRFLAQPADLADRVLALEGLLSQVPVLSAAVADFARAWSSESGSMTSTVQAAGQSSASAAAATTQATQALAGLGQQVQALLSRVDGAAADITALQAAAAAPPSPVGGGVIVAPVVPPPA